MDTPRVSIILPTYNRSKVLGRCIDSILAQTYENWELLVVDNNSSDASKALVASYCDPRIKFHTIQNSGIVARSRNLGLQLAVGAYIAFIDSDDWWEHSKLQTAVIHMEQGMDLAHHDLQLAYSRPRIWNRKTLGGRQLESNAFADLLANGNGIANSSVVVRASVTRIVGPISEDPEMVGSEDFDYWLRIAQVTSRIVYIDSVLGFYFIGSDNLSSYERKLMNLNALCRKYFSHVNENELRHLPLWIIYGRARSLFATRKYAESYRYCCDFMSRPSSLSMSSIKSISMLFVNALAIVWLNLFASKSTGRDAGK